MPHPFPDHVVQLILSHSSLSDARVADLVVDRTTVASCTRVAVLLIRTRQRHDPTTPLRPTSHPTRCPQCRDSYVYLPSTYGHLLEVCRCGSHLVPRR